MRFADITLLSDNVLRLRGFYERLFSKTAGGDEVHSWLALDGLTLTIDSANLLRTTETFYYATGDSANNIIISFDVEDVDAIYTHAKELGANMLNQPITHPWGARSFQCKDPDGNILNFRNIIT